MPRPHMRPWDFSNTEFTAEGGGMAGGPAGENFQALHSLQRARRGGGSIARAARPTAGIHGF